MGFLSGAASFSRFLVVGGAPKRLDQAVLDKLAEHVIGKQRDLKPDHVESGWVGGSHVLDRHFDLEKNILGDALQFGLRIDSAAVPPSLMRAYIRQEQEALAKDKPAGFPRGKLKSAARTAAQRRVELEIKEGRYHRMRDFPILIDSRSDSLLLASTSPAVIEQLHPLFKNTFGKRLELLSAGRLAYMLSEKAGHARRVEQARPAEFIKFPGGEGSPGVYWTLHDADSRDYLGNEFLLWLWWQHAEEGGEIELPDSSRAAIVFVKNLTLECPWGQYGRVTIGADGPTALPEARRAIQSGKLPRRAGLIVNRQNTQYELTLSAESLAVSGAILPKPEGAEGSGKFDPLERIDQLRDLCQTIDLLFDAFLKRRLAGNFEDRTRMTRWLRSAESVDTREPVAV